MPGVAMLTPYTLPTIDFVGGETQDLMFNVYFYKNHRPFSLTGCAANFAIVSFTNKMGTPILTKPMEAIFNEDTTINNVLTVPSNRRKRLDCRGNTSIKSKSRISAVTLRFPNRVSCIS